MENAQTLGATTFQGWRQELATRLQTAGTLLVSILATDGIQPKYVVRIEHASNVLLETATELASGEAGSGVLALAEVVRRIHEAVRRLRIVVNWHGVTSDTVLEDLALVLDGLDAALADAETLAGLRSHGKAHAHA